MSPVGWTFCSGIGAPEVAAPWVDWRLASEIEAFPRAVLQARFGYRLPADHNQGDPLLWDDMTGVTPELARRHGVPLPDILVAGTPCQSFSVAGLRKGLADERGNLTLTFVRICHDIVAARPDGKFTALWENVPGVLSDKGNAFGCLLGGLVGAGDALPAPGDGSWPGAGMVSGPRARAAWRVLDAQYFGVAQRRRRVFLVVSFGDTGPDPAKVLFEPQGLQGNSPPSREPGERSAPTLAARTRGGGGLGTDTELDGGLIPEVANPLTARMGKGINTTADEGQTPIPMVTHSLSAEGFDASEDGSGRGTPIVPFDTTQITSKANGSNPQPGDPSHPLASGAHPPAIVAFSSKDHGADATEELAPTLRAGGHSDSHANAGVPPAVAFDMRGREGGAQMGGPHNTANIRAASGGSSRSYVASAWAVRRLTPTECHRLQGFPDEHCAITYRGKQAADGPQYKALGNSMAVPVMRWILERIAA